MVLIYLYNRLDANFLNIFKTLSALPSVVTRTAIPLQAIGQAKMADDNAIAKMLETYAPGQVSNEDSCSAHVSICPNINFSIPFIKVITESI